MTDLTSTIAPARRPSWHLLGLEPVRAAFEYAAMRLAPPVSDLSGDGHPVVVFPGLASDQRAIAPLTRFCRGLGYATHDWGRGSTPGPTVTSTRGSTAWPTRRRSSPTRMGGASV